MYFYAGKKMFFFFFFLSDNQYIGEMRSSGIERISQNWFKFFFLLIDEWWKCR